VSKLIIPGGMNVKKSKLKFLFGKGRLLIPILFTVCILSGCKDSSNKEENIEEQVKAFNASIEKVSSNNAANSNIVIGSVNMGMNGEWFSEVMNGIRNAGSDLNVKLEMLDSESDLAKEKAHIDTLVEKGVDAIIISPIDSNVSAQSLQAAKNANIPIITWNTTVNMDITESVCVDNEALGGNTGDYMVEYIKTNDLKNVNLYLLTDTSYDIGIARCDGFKKAIADLVDEKKIKIVGEDNAETLDAGVEVTAAALKDHTDINMIWAWNQGALLGAIQAVKESGRKDIVVMGTDMSMALAEDMLKDDVNLQAITTQLPYNMGYMAVVNAVKAVNNEEIDKKALIPLSTIVKSEPDKINQYIENHKDLVDE